MAKGKKKARERSSSRELMDNCSLDKNSSARRNRNDNHCGDRVSTRKRNFSGQSQASSTNTARVKSQVVTTKRMKLLGTDSQLDQEEAESDLDLDQTGPVQKVQFDEGDNSVEISLAGRDRDEFPSNNEQTENESKEDGELPDESGDEKVDEHSMNEHTSEESEIEETVTTPRQSPVRKVVKKGKRLSVEEKIDDLSSSILNLQQIMEKQGIFNGKLNNKKQKCKVREGKQDRKSLDDEGEILSQSDSETTVYKAAIVMENDKHVDQDDPEISFKLSKGNDNLQQRRESSSSDDQIDTSDELLDVETFIAECQENAKKTQGETLRAGRDEFNRVQQARREEVVHNAEAGKARAYATPGNIPFSVELTPAVINPNIHQASVVDKNYVVIGNNLDKVLKSKIIQHQYIDFARLLPKDRMVNEDDHRMELVQKGGATFFVPVSGRENAGAISSFGRWEQTFRVFSNVYTKVYPERATELIQYNQLIHTAALSFTWDNVYRYDREFRMHLSNYPNRNWGVILQQARSVYLKDRISHFKSDDQGNRGSGSSPNPNKKKEICKRFNKGNCNRGFRCNFEHRCLGCGKFGHGIHICRNKKNGTEGGPNKNDKNGSPQ